MIRTLKKYLFYVVLMALAYASLLYHFIFFGREVRILEKDKLTWSYTFYSTNQKTGDQVMQIDALRDNGIGELLVEMNFITANELAALQQKYDY